MTDEWALRICIQLGQREHKNSQGIAERPQTENIFL